MPAQDHAKEIGLESINQEVLKAQLEILGCDWMEGRATGTKGAYMAADYIASMMKLYGLEPGGDMDRTYPSREERHNGVESYQYQSYFQNFNLLKSLPEKEENLRIIIEDKESMKQLLPNARTDFIMNSSVEGISIKAPVVFVGYGYKNEEENYNDFKGVDVKGKIILRLQGYPGVNDENSPAYSKFHEDTRYFEYYLNRQKDEMAREQGAIGVIELMNDYYYRYLTTNDVMSEYTYNENPRPKLSDYRMRLPGENMDDQFTSVLVSERLFNTLINNAEVDIDKYEKEAAYNLKSDSRDIKGLTVEASVQTETELINVRNVLGIIEGEKKDEIIVVGAHYDHMGANDGFVWNGTDDNASGTVGVLTLARAIMATGVKPKRTIVFAAWTGEERGLLGSRYFAENPWGDEINNIVLNINMDMISKDSQGDTLQNQTSMRYTEAFPFQEMTANHVEKYDLNLDIEYRPSERPRGGSDFTPFAAKDIPIMAHMAGFPYTYHTPRDGILDINWDKMENIIKLIYLNLWETANSDEWLGESE